MNLVWLRNLPSLSSSLIYVHMTPERLETHGSRETGDMRNDVNWRSQLIVPLLELLPDNLSQSRGATMKLAKEIENA